MAVSGIDTPLTVSNQGITLSATLSCPCDALQSWLRHTLGNLKAA